jgi:hypothetical protein
MSNFGSFDPVASGSNTVTPFLSQQSLPFLFNTQSHQATNDVSQQFFQGVSAPNVVRRLSLSQLVGISNIISGLLIPSKGQG